MQRHKFGDIVQVMLETEIQIVSLDPMVQKRMDHSSLTWGSIRRNELTLSGALPLSGL